MASEKLASNNGGDVSPKPEANASHETEDSGAEKVTEQQDRVPDAAETSLPLVDQNILPIDGLEFSCFGRLPTELKQMIWSKNIDAPAAHTFKIEKTDASTFGQLFKYRHNALWALELVQMPWNKRHGDKSDPSAYRFWKACIETRDASFLSYFKSTRGKELSIIWPIHKPSWKSNATTHAAFVGDTDLIIIEFERVQFRRSWNFWHHDPTALGNMDLSLVRRRLQNMKKVAINYRECHPNSLQSSCPLVCSCVVPLDRDFCKRYKICAQETACFLDCFPDLQEFYLIVDWGRKSPYTTFAKEHRQAMIEQDWVRIDQRSDLKSRNIACQRKEVARFFDVKNEYMELPVTHDGILYTPKGSINPYESRDVNLGPLVARIRQIFRKRRSNGRFATPLAQRKKLKVSILLRVEDKPKKSRASLTLKQAADTPDRAQKQDGGSV